MVTLDSAMRVSSVAVVVCKRSILTGLPDMELCIICKDTTRDGDITVHLRTKGSQGINQASSQRGDTRQSSPAKACCGSMAQWNSLQQLDTKYLNQLDHLYENFPMEVRQFLADWLEKQDWNQAASDISYATILFHMLLENVEMQTTRFSTDPNPNFLLLHNLRRVKQQLQTSYSSEPVLMAQIISRCLKEEKIILDRATMNHGSSGYMRTQKRSILTERQVTLDQTINNEVKKRVQIIQQNMRILEDFQDEFDFLYKNSQSRDGGETTKMEPRSPPQTQTSAQEEAKQLQGMLLHLDQSRKEILHLIAELIAIINYTLSKPLLEELQEWKRSQQIACIGGPPMVCLRQLEYWFTTLAETLLQIRRQLKKLEELHQKVTYTNDPIPSSKEQLEGTTDGLLKTLFQNAFVLEQQPCMPTHPQRPLVLKTSVQFTAKIRLLVKLPELNYQLKVKACIDKEITGRPPGKSFRRFNILGTNTKVMNIEEENGALAVDFRHLQVKEQRAMNGGRNEGALIVTEELHLITFETEIYHQGLKLDLETTSLPVIIISNVSQLPNGWASILWYNMLCCEQKNVTFFLNPPAANWKDLSEALSWQFSCVTSRGLNTDQLATLAEKLLGLQENSDNCLVPWTKFCKENLPQKPFSFWLWLDGIIELIKKHLITLWNDGYIMGFVSKEKEKNLLKNKPYGTFLLRFSESSRDGGITFTWVKQSSSDLVEIQSVEPYTKQHLAAVSFPDIIFNFKIISDTNIPNCPLKYLYPDIDMDKAFSKYLGMSSDIMDQEQSDSKGYIPTKFIPVHMTRVSQSLGMFPLTPEDLVELTESELSHPFPQFSLEESIPLAALLLE
uniref:signal transducer and activator of transcription 1-alpha/beta-like isoform X3 n=1 Tax=Myxine glutinosa TaxID=7769 RepID=UPI00358F5081